MDDNDPNYDRNDLHGLRVATGLDDIDQKAAEEYWSKLKRALRDVFGRRDAQAMIEAYRKHLRKAGPDAEFLAYHVDPLQVAADLAGEEILTVKQKVAYSKILEHFGASPEHLPDANALEYGSPENAARRPAAY